MASDYDRRCQVATDLGDLFCCVTKNREEDRPGSSLETDVFDVCCVYEQTGSIKRSILNFVIVKENE